MKFKFDRKVEKASKDLDLHKVKKAIRDGELIDVLVERCDYYGNLKTYLDNNMILFISNKDASLSNLGVDLTDDEYNAYNKKLVGKIITVKPMKITYRDEKPGIIHCSRVEAQKECFDKYICELKNGDVIPVKFIGKNEREVILDVGCGVPGTILRKDISMARISSMIEEIDNASIKYAAVLKVEKYGKIFLTHKELLGTWREQLGDLKDGDILEGVVQEVHKYGTFVNIGQNIAGLMDLSDNYPEDLMAGDGVKVKVVGINAQKQKIKLEFIERTSHDGFHPRRFEYSITSGHIDEWVYTPDEASKQVKVTFD